MKRRELIRHLSAKGGRSCVKAQIIHGGKIQRSTDGRLFRATRKSTASLRGKSAVIWELKNHDIKTHNGGRIQGDDVPAAPHQSFQRIFKEIIRKNNPR